MTNQAPPEQAPPEQALPGKDRQQPQPFADEQKAVQETRSPAEERAIQREENAALDKKARRVDRVHAIQR